MFAPRMAMEVAESNGLNYQRDLVEGQRGLTSRVLTWMIQRVKSYDPHAIGQRSLEGEDSVYSFDATSIGTNDIGDMMLLLGISAVVALVISTLALTFMIRHAQLLIKFALLFNITSVALVRFNLVV